MGEFMLNEKPESTSPNSAWFAYVEDGAGNVYKVQLANLPGGGGGLTALSTPTLTATVISSTQIDLSWTNVANESSYLLQRSPDNSAWTTINSPAANVTTYSNTGLTASTLYYYRIKAVGDGVTYSDSGYGTDSDTTSAGSSYDTDAQAYFTAAGDLSMSGYTDTQVKDAYNALVVSLKADSLYTGNHAMYPLLGTTAAKQKWNSLDPVDNVANHRMDFSAGDMSHTVAGWINNPNVLSTGYANTNFNPSTDGASLTNFGASIYIKTKASQSTVDLDCSADNDTKFALSSFGGNTLCDIWGTSQGRINTAAAGTTGLITGCRETDSIQKIYRNGTQTGSTNTTTVTIEARPNYAIHFGAQNGAGTISGHTENVTYAFLFLHQGFTAAQVALLNTHVTTFLTAIGRN